MTAATLDRAVAHAGHLVDTLTGEVIRPLLVAASCLLCGVPVRRNGTSGAHPKYCAECKQARRRESKRAHMARVRGTDPETAALRREIEADRTRDPHLWAAPTTAVVPGRVPLLPSALEGDDGTRHTRGGPAPSYMDSHGPDRALRNIARRAVAGADVVTLHQLAEWGEWVVYDPAEYLPRLAYGTGKNSTAAAAYAARRPGTVVVCVVKPKQTRAIPPTPDDKCMTTHDPDVAAGLHRHRIAARLHYWLAEHPRWASGLTEQHRTDEWTQTVEGDGVAALPAAA